MIKTHRHTLQDWSAMQNQEPLNWRKHIPGHIAIKTHWDWVTHICVSKLTSIGSDNGLSPGRHQAIIWTNAGILLIGPLGKNFSEILIEISTFSFNKMHLKMSSAKWRLFRLGLNELKRNINLRAVELKNVGETYLRTLQDLRVI